jgi:hypothetical protein
VAWGGQKTAPVYAIVRGAGRLKIQTTNQNTSKDQSQGQGAVSRTVLRSLREARGLSIRGMLREIDDPRLNRMTYTAVERGDTLGSAGGRAALEEYFKVPVAVLVTPVPERGTDDDGR